MLTREECERLEAQRDDQHYPLAAAVRRKLAHKRERRNEHD